MYLFLWDLLNLDAEFVNQSGQRFNVVACAIDKCGSVAIEKSHTTFVGGGETVVFGGVNVLFAFSSDRECAVELGILCFCGSSIREVVVADGAGCR